MEFPKRKPTRLKGYDYSECGMYFLTVCTKNRKQLFGKIVGCGDFDAPQIMLSDYGKILDKYIRLMSDKYTHISVDKYVIMPNHFHMILKITEKKNGLSASAKPYNNETSKFVSLLKRYCNREYGENIFQASFNDHIIRGEADYKEIWEYINNNPLKLEEYFLPNKRCITK